MKSCFKTLSLIFFIVLPYFGFGQFQSAEDYYENLSYQAAIKKYSKIVRKQPDNGEALFHLANSYRLNGQPQKAQRWFEKAVRYYPEPKCKLYYAQTLMSNGGYVLASQWFENYAAVAVNPYDAQNARKIADFCKKIAEGEVPKSNYSIFPVPFNSEKLDFSPAFFRTNELIFASNRKNDKIKEKEDPWTSDNFVDLFLVEYMQNGEFGEVRSFPKGINSIYHEGPACYVPLTNVLYFTRSDYMDKKRGFDDNENTRLQIYRVDYAKDQGEEKGKWENIERLPFNSNMYSCCHPAVSKDGTIMYFASDMPGGQGGMDLYYTTRQDSGIWTTPVNLGPKINTAGNEIFPFLYDENTMYFSSDFHIGFGGLDVFKTKRKGENWESPINIGTPINSLRDDFGFIINEDEKGFLTSNRSGKDDDIYQFRKKLFEQQTDEEEVLETSSGLKRNYVCGIVINEKYGNPLRNAKVSMYNKCSGESETITTDSTGRFEFFLPDECDYVIVAKKETFEDGAARITTIDTSYEDCIPVEIPLKFIETEIPGLLTTDIKIKEGMLIELYHVYFDFDKYYIRPDAVPDLETLYQILIKYPEMRGELWAHTDCRGTHAYNIRLSNNRAKSAYNYLIKKGIDPSRLSWRGFGETRLKNHCADGVKCNEVQHQRNRRVEFKVTYFDETWQSKEQERYVE